MVQFARLGGAYPNEPMFKVNSVQLGERISRFQDHISLVHATIATTSNLSFLDDTS